MRDTDTDELTVSLKLLAAIPLTMALSSDSVNNGTDNMADTILRVINSTTYIENNIFTARVP